MSGDREMTRVSAPAPASAPDMPTETAAADADAMPEVKIRGSSIRLGQLLKLTGLADSGGGAKALLAENAVRVNGEPESRRGRQLTVGDVVSVASEAVRIV